MKLKDIQIKSFVTALNQPESGARKGGYVPTNDDGCFTPPYICGTDTCDTVFQCITRIRQLCI